ncbi:MAG: nuclear transport factor 2 family protein [Gemmatimonadota bacterium]
MIRYGLGRLVRSAWLAMAVAVVGGGAAPDAVAGQSRADTLAVRAAALDYVEGWFTADADRMRRALHPDLVKQMPIPDGTLQHSSAEELIEMTSRAGGADRDWSDAIEVLAIFEDVASVRADVPGWVDLLHIVRTDDEWRIVHVLWDLRDGR